MAEPEHHIEIWTTGTCSCGWEHSSESEGDVWVAALAHERVPVSLDPQEPK